MQQLARPRLVRIHTWCRDKLLLVGGRHGNRNGAEDKAGASMGPADAIEGGMLSLCTYIGICVGIRADNEAVLPQRAFG